MDADISICSGLDASALSRGVLSLSAGINKICGAKCFSKRYFLTASFYNYFVIQNN